ncbi:G-D-S-L family lipolytic protein [Hanstruepera neustonica]|uniref:G-D-S-L family lipolytic protein n=1 Tax=Hanstruepera neustonica TaxID=1445657 RepID=A0A2K1E3V3_9FLAO|nr:G-D-S-L family lipolytic protein [Hanstruepera neustonica]PNQ74947.1 G-D-S-L family lipolytic protein [Hanstruepera neustonica]
MKKIILNTKYVWLLAVLLSFTACESDDDSSLPIENLPPLTAGEADFSKYVSLGNSLTSGFSDGALFIATQENSFPNILAQKFSMTGGGAFTQPLMNDNFGGLALAGNRIPNFNPRLVTTGGAPLPLEAVIGPVTVTTDIALNNPTGPFNNMGVPGARSFHLIAPGYGNIMNLPNANPYFVRMTGSTPNASVLELSMAQQPTFFSLWIGNNDVLGYALSGGDGTSPITDQPTFDFAISTLITTLTSQGAKGVVANIPYVTDITHFTTVPYNPVPLDAATAGALNAGYAQYNGGLQLALAGGLISAEEAEMRTIVFSEDDNNSMVLVDEDLTDLSGLGLPSYRQSTSDDLFVLTLSSLIPEGYGTQIPLEDRWVLTPEEQAEIRTAVDGFNATIQAAANQAGLAFVDANALLSELNSTGIASGNFVLTSDLVTGGMFSLDGVHLTSRGYAVAANEFMKAIDATYGSNFEASGNLVDIGQYPTNYSPTLQ